MTRSSRPQFGVSIMLLLGLLFASMMVALTLGPADIGATDVLRALTSRLGLTAAEVSRLREAIIVDLRLPRLLTAAATGAGLALCGAIMQALTRNPLADPYLLGLSSGAALGAVIFLILGASLLMPLGAFLGAVATLAVTLAVTRLLGGATPGRAILAGIAISALAAAVTSLLIFWTSTGDSYREILSWLMGSLAGVTWPEALLVSLVVLVVGVPLVSLGGALDAFAFGDTAAASLGVDVTKLRWLLLGATALITGLLVAVGGAIGFVGLVVPHMVRLAVGTRHRLLFPMCMLTGAIFMVWCDTVARTAFDPRELPVGIITAMIGAPAFLLVLLRFRRLT